MNVANADVIRYLKLFTLLSKEEITRLEGEHAVAPHERVAHRELVRRVTVMLHGSEELERVEAATQALFSGNVGQLDEATMLEAFAEVPHSTHRRSTLQGGGVSLVELLPQTSLAKSRREARELLSSGAVSVNGQRVDVKARLTMDDVLYGHTVLIRRGKKSWHATKWE